MERGLKGKTHEEEVLPQRAAGIAPVLEFKECWDTALSHRAGGWVVLRGAEVGLSDPCGSL